MFGGLDSDPDGEEGLRDSGHHCQCHKLFIVAHVVVVVVEVRGKNEQHRILRIPVLRTPGHWRHIEAEIRAVQEVLLAVYAIIDNRAHRPFETD